MKRVLISGAVLDQGPGGVRRHNQELLPRVARLLAEAGGELAILTPKGGLSFDVGKIARLIPTNILSGPPALRFFLESRATKTELVAAAKSRQPYDVMHTAHLPMPRLPDFARGRISRTHTIHDLRVIDQRESNGLRGLLGKPTLKRALQSANRVLTVSETVRAQLIDQKLVVANRCSVVPNAGDHFVPKPRATVQNAAMLHVGHLEPRKNLELLIHALALAPDLPRLQLAGAAKHGADLKLIELAQQLQVADRLEILGAVSENELLELYANAACVVIPSRLEGFGIGVLEAQLARAPLACSSAGALPEIAGEQTPSFDPDNAEECVGAIRTAMLASQAELDEAEARAQRFSWDKSANLFYNALIE